MGFSFRFACARVLRLRIGEFWLFLVVFCAL